MKLYHYSVDSYKGAGRLTNDYKNNYRFAEPYILALQQSGETFLAVFYATMYMSREIQSLGLRKYENYQKDTVEGIFEYVRETEFPNDPSRLRCVFYCESKKEALDYAQDDCLSNGLLTKEQVVLLEVEVEESRIGLLNQEIMTLVDLSLSEEVPLED